MTNNAIKGAPAGTDTGGTKQTVTQAEEEQFPDHSTPGSGAIKGGEAKKPGQMEGDEDQSPKD